MSPSMDPLAGNSCFVFVSCVHAKLFSSHPLSLDLEPDPCPAAPFLTPAPAGCAPGCPEGVPAGAPWCAVVSGWCPMVLVASVSLVTSRCDPWCPVVFRGVPLCPAVSYGVRWYPAVSPGVVRCFAVSTADKINVQHYAICGLRTSVTVNRPFSDPI